MRWDVSEVGRANVEEKTQTERRGGGGGRSLEREREGQRLSLSDHKSGFARPLTHDELRFQPRASRENGIEDYSHPTQIWWGKN